ncbi:MAG: hypothetical protein COA79_24560 [Planctomycetota bacterium]|nr:MAG: hypothetical protein COA79_24560 [Planctomycetota bacterium]
MSNIKSMLILIFITLLFSTELMAETKVNVIKTPNGGIQPKVRVDKSGQIHLVYYKGSDSGGDLFYIKKPKGGSFSSPTQVNSISGSAISAGTIRGAQFTLGQNDSIHVVWNSSQNGDLKKLYGPAMFYASMTDKATKFSSQKVVTGKRHVDGGGAVAADKNGNVYIFFHSGAGPKGGQEKNRRVFIAVSRNGGKKFGKARPISPATGVCGCCAMQADCDSNGNVYAVYRTATNNKSRDINLLVSKSKGKKFGSKILDKWPLNRCPMSSMSFCENTDRMIIGWETNKQIKYTSVAKGSLKAKKVVSPNGGSKSGKHPVFAISSEGNILVVWTEGTGWKKGGSIAWQELDSSMKSISKTGRLPAGVSIWNFVASYFDAETKTFNILH